MTEQLAAGFGTVTAGVLLLFGAYATGVSRGFAFRKLPAAIRQAFHADPSAGKGSFRAFAASLAGTVGVGNLTGVSVAIAGGGAGAVFWMWISALLCMIIKYFEIWLSVRHQPPEETAYAVAPMKYIRKSTGSRGFAAVFALAGVFSALTMGNLLQTDAAAVAVQDSFGLPEWVTAVIFSAATGIVVFGGRKRILNLAEKAIPAAGIAYLVLGTVVILFRASAVPRVMGQIFQEAFSLKSAGSGVLGLGIARAIRFGVGNGLFSHEAGLGSAGLAHGLSKASPERQGLWGIFEVFIDTIVISTVSAVAILVCGADGGDGNGVTKAAEAVFGRWGGGAVTLCLTVFAFLSIASWGMYGETCFYYLTGEKSIFLFRFLFVLAPLLAACASTSALWNTAETVNGIMMIFHLTGLVGFRRELRRFKSRS